MKTSTGNRLWVNLSTIVYDEPTRRNRRLVVHLPRDISQRKANEQLLVRMLPFSKELVAASGTSTAFLRSLHSLHKSSEFSGYSPRRKTRAEIARELSITLSTLRNHLHSINEKLRTHNRLEAVMHAMQRGLI